MLYSTLFKLGGGGRGGEEVTSRPGNFLASRLFHQKTIAKIGEILIGKKSFDTI